MLTESQIETIVAQGIASIDVRDKKVLVIVPDRTRTMPMPLFFRLLTQYLLPEVAALDFMIALGTHAGLSEESMLAHMGITPEEKATSYAHVGLINHAWNDPNALLLLGTIPCSEIEQLSGGRLSQEVPVRLNKAILDYDELIICGPVFPHEVAGFSGGNKYFFPGIAGADIIDFTHWLGALITSYEIIGTKDTPVRRVIDRAAAMIPRSRHAFCCVVTHETVEGVFFGTPEESWPLAADLAAQTHVKWLDRPYKQVLAVMPSLYDDIWTGAKGMYKTEPVIADGGGVIIYAPRISEISYMHGHLIRQIGYHVRDYFTKQWDRFKQYPGGIIAHSTHLRGIGTYDAATQVECPRVSVTLATGIPAEVCREVNLGYLDPRSIDVDEWLARKDDDLLVIPRAGEYLYRLKR
jgi:nickel-dependent lactate racemase